MSAAPAPASRLPHRYPFLLIDRVLMMDRVGWAVAMKRLTRDDPLLDGEGLLAPVLLAEAMAQAAGLAVADMSAPRRPLVLAQVDRFRCRPPIGAGDELVVTVRVIRRFGTAIKVHASIHVAGRRRAAAALVLQVPAR